jgi:TPR repeat protein
LSEVVRDVLSGASRIATLVGGSSTGKTRACWEAVKNLPEPWSLWHPFDPSRPEAAVQGIGMVGPHSVVWLNEAQQYLLTPDLKLGERVAAGVRTLLSDPARAPVLVLATVWPRHWARLTEPPATDGYDPHAQARELLSGTDISVPDSFSAVDLAALRADTDDPRLRRAADHAGSGRVAQYLAGAPEVMQRYRNAPGTARAVMDVAIDARRMGHPPAIPRALLELAAPGYLSDYDWIEASDDWLDQALAYTAMPCHGVPGPLTAIRLRPGESPPSGGPSCYVLADYLEQTGRLSRAGTFPPGSFWKAVATVVFDSELLMTIGRQAARRGRYKRAATLYRKAADHGLTSALLALALLRDVAGDVARAAALAREAADQGDTAALIELARRRETSGDRAAAERLLWQAAERGDTWPLRDLIY